MLLAKKAVLCASMFLCVFVVLGCAKKEQQAGQSKSANPPKQAAVARQDAAVEQTRQDVENMSADELRAMALKCKEQLAAKEKQVGEVVAKSRAIGSEKMTDKKAEAIKKEMTELLESKMALTEQFDLCRNKLVQDGADVSDLDM